MRRTGPSPQPCSQLNTTHVMCRHALLRKVHMQPRLLVEKPQCGRLLTIGGKHLSPRWFTLRHRRERCVWLGLARRDPTFGRERGLHPQRQEGQGAPGCGLKTVIMEKETCKRGDEMSFLNKSRNWGNMNKSLLERFLAGFLRELAFEPVCGGSCRHLEGTCIAEQQEQCKSNQVVSNQVSFANCSR